MKGKERKRKHRCMKEIKGYVLKTPLLSDKQKLTLPHHQWLTAATTVITFELNDFFFLQFFILFF